MQKACPIFVAASESGCHVNSGEYNTGFQQPRLTGHSVHPRLSCERMVLTCKLSEGGARGHLWYADHVCSKHPRLQMRRQGQNGKALPACWLKSFSPMFHPCRSRAAETGQSSSRISCLGAQQTKVQGEGEAVMLQSDCSFALTLHFTRACRIVIAGVEPCCGYCQSALDAGAS